MLPNVYLFNPTCEYAIANGTVSWQPNRLLQQMEADLGTLPMFFAKPHDYVLVKKAPNDEFVESLRRIGYTPPKFVHFDEALADPAFVDMPKASLNPWGWSPAAHHLLKPLKDSCNVDFHSSSNSFWLDDCKEMYSKRIASRIFKEVLSSASLNCLVPQQYVGELCRSLDQVKLLFYRWGKLMVKAPLSSAGRGLQKVSELPVHPSVAKRINGIIREQGFVMVEPLFDKELDFAFQFEINNNDIYFIGISYFKTDTNGQYVGSYLNGIPANIDPTVKKLITDSVEIIVTSLSKVIRKSIIFKNYRGYLGIDAMVIRNSIDQFKIHSCLEINLRYNMGLLAFKIEQHILSDKKGMFKTFYEPGKSFQLFCNEMDTKHPPKFVKNKIEKGFFPLTDPSNGAQFGAFVIMGKQ